MSSDDFSASARPFSALATVYDDMMSDVEYDHWADFALTWARDKGFSPHTALDLACGTGNFSRELQKLGLRVTGLDGSAEMLEVARGAPDLEGVDFHQGDLRTWTLPQKFDLITCVFDSLNNLHTLEDLGAAFARAREHLANGGAFIFDLNTPTGVQELWENDVMEGVILGGTAGEVHYHWSHRADPESGHGIVSASWTCIFPDGREERHTELHEERGYTPAEVEDLLQRAGFAGWELAEYPDFAAVSDETPRLWAIAWTNK